MSSKKSGKTDDIVQNGSFLESKFTYAVEAEKVVYIFSGDPVEAYHFLKQIRAYGLRECVIRYMFGGDATDFCRSKYFEYFPMDEKSANKATT